MHDVPKDLGRRILEAAGLAVQLHLQSIGALDGVDCTLGGTESVFGASAVAEAERSSAIDFSPMTRVNRGCESEAA